MKGRFPAFHQLQALPRQVINFVYSHIPRRTDPQIVSTAERVLSNALIKFSSHGLSAFLKAAEGTCCSDATLHLPVGYPQA
jgi:hypothetical protein